MYLTGCTETSFKKILWHDDITIFHHLGLTIWHTTKLVVYIHVYVAT